MATLPDMWERTITIGSAGKTFSVTGWKLGWAVGPQHLIRNCQVAIFSNFFLPSDIPD
jgi:kynurenine--oxoglutarate transaminase/cysteine-S-conjugate beta-lyase/glutamine--phenylpyruvate transaminase